MSVCANKNLQKGVDKCDEILYNMCVRLKEKNGEISVTFLTARRFNNMIFSTFVFCKKLKIVFIVFNEKICCGGVHRCTVDSINRLLFNTKSIIRCS